MKWRSALDVSHYQGTIDWSAVVTDSLPSAGPIVAVWAKASEGSRYVDATFATNRDGARAAGLLVGGYHFARPSGEIADAVDEARHFAAQLTAVRCDLPPMLDVESTLLDHAATATWTLTCALEIQRLIGVRPMIYTGAYFTGPHGMTDVRLAAFPLWLAAYPAGSTPDPDPAALRLPRLPEAWQRWAAWQFTSSSSIEGIAGRCDANVVDAAWLDSVLPAPLPTPTPTPTPPLTKGDDMRFIRLRGNHTQWLSHPLLAPRPVASPAEKASYVATYHVEIKVVDIDDEAMFRKLGCVPDDELGGD